MHTYIHTCIHTYIHTYTYNLTLTKPMARTPYTVQASSRQLQQMTPICLPRAAMLDKE